MKRLFIAEKPSLGRAIAQGLGGGRSGGGCIVCNGGSDVVTWCFGHILEQLQPSEYDARYQRWSLEDLPIVPAIWRNKVAEKCAEQFEVIKRLVGEAEVIVNGGDPDREGQLLVDEVLDFIGNKKPVKRVLLNALDDTSVQAALTHLRDNKDFVGLKNSALARQRADWLIGYNLSRAYTVRMRQAGYDGVTPVGRVQTPTMALVVRREREIQNFKPVKYFVLKVDWQHKNGSFTTTWKPDDTIDGLDASKRVVKRGAVDDVISKLTASPQGKVTTLTHTAKKEPQRLPYALSSLQVEAGRKYGFSPQTVLDTMQALYERKLTTYPRSDCEFLPAAQLKDAGRVLSHLRRIDALAGIVDGADTAIKSRAWNDKKITAHHAIVPTGEAANFATMSDVEQKLYALVAKAFIAQFYPVHEYKATKVEVTAEGELFTATGRTVTVPGWKSVYANDEPVKETDDKGNEKEAEEVSLIPAMRKSDKVSLGTHRVQDKQTTKPSRFTPATLLEAMKKIYNYVRDPAMKPLLKDCQGIGTEATRARIIEQLQERGYLTLNKKALVPTEKANRLVDVLSEDITYPDTTALWEKALDEIRNNRSGLDDFTGKQLAILNQLLQSAKEVEIAGSASLVKCPNCGRHMRRLSGKPLPGQASRLFWACTGYPNSCTTTVPDVNGKPDYEHARGGKIASCPRCGHRMFLHDGKHGRFWGCENRDNCNLMLSDHNGAPVAVKCPKCGKDYLHRWASKKQPDSYFWSCGDRGCRTFLADKDGLPDLPKPS